MKRIIALMMLVVTSLVFPSLSFASNPVIRTDENGEFLFTADVAALVDGDTVYLYTGHDEATTSGTFFSMKDWLCFSSTDMVNWKYESTPLKRADFTWADGNSAWAAQVAKKGDTYYWYVTVHTTGGYAIGVATSSSPTGPFTDALKRPLVKSTDTVAPSSMGTDTWDDIDPTIWIEDNGDAYLYWGNSHLYYAKLTDDMLGIDGDIHQVTINNLDGNYTEAPWIHKYNGKYYLSFANNHPERLAYAMSDSITGPWEYKGVLMDPLSTSASDHTQSNTSHQSIVEFKGKWYILYHTAALPSGGEYRRATSVEELLYNPDGTIQKVIPTSTGLDGVSNKIQSYSSPNKYISHYASDARIDPSKPQQDNYNLRWEIVPGLADSAEGYVSFQAVNKPGYYLKQTSNDFALAKNDNTDSFKQNATFKVVPGLAEPTWSSFQFYNDDSMYIAQKDFFLKLRQVSSEQDKKDATFKVLDADVKAVSFDKDSVTLQEGASTTLTAVVDPFEALNKKVTFVSSNTSVATLVEGTYDDVSGTSVKVIAKAAGTAQIKAVTDEGQLVAIADVIVESKPQVISSISNVTVSKNGERISVVGNIEEGMGQKIALRVTAANGKVDYIDQINSQEGGSFSFLFTPSNGYGNYTIELGAPTIENPYQTTFNYKQSSSGDSDGNNDSGGDSNSGGSSHSGGGSSHSSGSTNSTANKDKEPTEQTTVPNETTTEQTTPDDIVITKTFSDVTEQNYGWAKKAVEILASQGIIKGTSENTFDPASNIKRADAIVLLVRALNLDAEIKDNFDDVSKDAYYYEPLGIAKALGITNGVDGKRFNPKAEISRQDLMVLIARALELSGKLEASENTEVLNRFTDSSEVSGYAKEGVASLVENGIIQGSGDNINPKGKATRAEVAVMIYRILYQE